MIYISGPISNLENYREVFALVKTDAERRFGGEWITPDFDKPGSYTDYMARDLLTLARCAAVLRIAYCYRNGGWEKSEGSNFEYYCARQDSKPVFDCYVCEQPDGTLAVSYDAATLTAITEFLK